MCMLTVKVSSRCTVLFKFSLTLQILERAVVPAVSNKTFSWHKSGLESKSD